MSRPGEASTLSSNDSTETNLEPIRTPVPITSTPGNDRLSIPYMLRLPTAILFSSFSGFLLGAAHGGSTSALRFRAENAHRLPTSQVGWYLYHKSKNYHVMLGGIKEGLRMGFKVGFWSGSFFAMEEAEGEERELGLEKMEGEDEVWVQRDFLSSVVAALGTAGGFSAWNRFPVPTAARTATIALKLGLGFGLAQDALSLMRGRRLGYIEVTRKFIFGKREEEKAVAMQTTG
ncbi:hypothetical protein H2203_006739 [Taxawa tesnikishii (nom. ined.)]|nr:hypothetical protein H2203_006739 [Dothideales sp. JES 119]